MNKKITWYSDIRVLCTVLVVIGHCTNLTLINRDGIANVVYLNSIQKYTEYIRTIIYSFHMPLFVTLSGAVFFYAYNENLTLKTFIKKKIYRLLVPFFGTAFFVLIPQRYLTEYYQNRPIRVAILQDVLLAYDVNYLWYLLMLFEVSVIFFFVTRIILNAPQSIRYIFFGLFLVSFISFSLPLLPFQINKVLEFSFWFLVGIIIEKKRNEFERINHKDRYAFFFLLIWGITFFLFYYLNSMLAISTQHYLLPIKVAKMSVRYVMEGAAVLFVCFLLAKHPMKKSQSYKIIEKYSMQIYLFHCPVIHIYKYVVAFLIASDNMSNVLYFSLLLIGNFLAILVPIFLSSIWEKKKYIYGGGKLKG